MSPTLRCPLFSVLLASAALGSIRCAASRPGQATTTTVASSAWSITMLGGECTLHGQGDQATAGACAGLGALDLQGHSASGHLGAMVAALPAGPGEPAAGGWPAAQLTRAGAPAVAVADGWVPIARELKALLRQRPAGAASVALPVPATFHRWHVTAGDGRCQLAGEGAQVLTIDCPAAGAAVNAGADLSAVTTWLGATSLDPARAEAPLCVLTTELAAPYPLSDEHCGRLTTLLGTLARGAAGPRDPMNKIGSSGTMALAQLKDGQAPVVEVLIEWTASPADRDRIRALGGVFMSTTPSSNIEGLRIPLRALPAVAALTSVSSIELGQALTSDGSR
ncbi:MAG: hypothetical protein KBG28_16370 [Kofleriaceae bacterium]|nr:hypothetical protein [Kofleriaceae bacterium]